MTHKHIGRMIPLAILLIGIGLSSCSPYAGLEPMQSMQTDLEYPHEVQRVTLPGDFDVAYTDQGSGEQTLIFIHGLGSYLRAWDKNIAALKSQYRVIALDLPGYGRSGKHPHEGSMSFYASIIAHFMDALELDQAVVAGHSMGGQIAMVTALQYPDKVKKLVLVAPAGFERFSEGQKAWFRDVMSLSGVKKTPANAIITNLAYNFYNMPDDAEFMITDRLAMRTAEDFDNYCYTVAQSVDGMVDEPVIDKLHLIEQPVLIAFGENDNLIPNRYLNPGRTRDIAEQGHTKLPNSELLMVPNCGHFLQFEQPQALNEAIREFLQ